MRSARSLIVRLGVFAAAMILLLVGVFQTIERPVGGESTSYTAIFADANGLQAGDDVRVYGVRVGKVGGLELDGVHARVTFTVARSRAIFTNTNFAIRYQNLSGQRYLDIQQPDRPQDELPAGATIGTDHTIPAFDITTLFNGLQPVLANLTPADLNQFATSMLAVVQGDGSQVGAALDAIDKIANHYIRDRQAVISTLVRNLAAVSDHLGNKSGSALALLSGLTDVFENLQEKTVGLTDYMVTIPPVIYPAQHMLDTVGLDKVPNPELAELLHKAFPDPQEVVDVLNQVPGVLQQLAAMVPASVDDLNPTCAHGTAPAPQPLQVLITGQRISLCNG